MPNRTIILGMTTIVNGVDIGTNSACASRIDSNAASSGVMVVGL